MNMSEKVEILCTICARGGSKGVPNKNLRVVAGLPLVAHSVVQALNTGIFSRVAVSSDSHEILEAAKAAGATDLIERPSHLSSDISAKLPAIVHCAKSVEAGTGVRYKYFVDLDVTSPLRLEEDIQGALNMVFDENTECVITGSISRRSPYFNLVEEVAGGGLAPSKLVTDGRSVVRRQDVPRTFDMNASIYVWSREALFEKGVILGPRTKIFEMPEERSLDIDSEFDFRLVKGLIEGRF